MQGENSGLSRRSFLTGAAATAGLVSFSMLAGCAAEGTGNTGAPVEWSEAYDIVVVGFGAAGGGAAAEAAANGADVLILEKMDEAQAGGSSTCFANAWFPTSAASLMFNSFGTIDNDTAQAREAMSHEAMELMAGYGLQLLPSGYEIDGGSKKFYEILSANVQSTEGVTVEYDSPVMGLVQDRGTGEVQGVRVVRDGQDIYIKAKKAVVVTTGGFEGNLDLVHTFAAPLVPLAQVGGPAHTGEGLMMCLEAGAALEHFPKGFDWYEFCFRKASEEMGTGLAYRWYTTDNLLTGGSINPAIHDSHILVDMKGQRFMDEFTYVTHNKSQLEFTAFDGGMYSAVPGYKHMPFFMVFDSLMMNDGPLGKYPYDNTPWTWAAVHDVYDWSDDNQAELEKGWIIRADTIEELASKMTSNDYWTGETLSMDAAGLSSGIEKYNAGCAAGADEYGRDPDYLNPVAQPPFYAIEMIPGSLYTICGPVSNVNSQVVTSEGEPIPRLYCAGNVGQGVEMSPIGVCACMGNGMIASRHAVTLDAWS